MAETTLALDLGKTGCRAALWIGETRSDAEGAGAPGLVAPDGLAAAERAVLPVAGPLLRALGIGRVNRACIGAAGALTASVAAARLAARLADALPSDEVAVASDAITSHAGALGGAAGVVLAIGTGSVALALDHGAMRRADGWGPLLGDEGGGGWIGLHGLRAALRAADGRGRCTALRPAAERMFGPPASWPAAVDSASVAARFAPKVARAAVDGDDAARTILRDAAEHLAATARSAASALPPGARCAVVGGLARLGAPLMDRLERLLGEAGLRFVPAQGTALDGARLLAIGTHWPHEAHIIRCRPSRKLA
jgi:glucosamine kinase